MVISANTLFHFTKSFDTLLSILRTHFYPRLCVEKVFCDKLENSEYAIPMVCFCDIPLSSISNHTAKYGDYAIGLKKSWAIENDVNPILYIHENSKLVRQYQEIFNWIVERQQKGDSCLSDVQSRLLSMFFMMKQYEGCRDAVDEKNIRYYDEREWRYIPPISTQKPNFLKTCEFGYEQKRDSINKYNERFGVRFTPDVINYIIVQKDEEVVNLIHQLHSIKGGFPYKSLELLTSRILTMDRIREDF